MQLINVGELNAYDVLCNDWIVFTQGSLSALIDRDGGAESLSDAELTMTRKPRPLDPDRSTDEASAGTHRCKRSQ